MVEKSKLEKILFGRKTAFGLKKDMSDRKKVGYSMMLTTSRQSGALLEDDLVMREGRTIFGTLEKEEKKIVGPQTLVDVLKVVSELREGDTEEYHADDERLVIDDAQWREYERTTSRYQQYASVQQSEPRYATRRNRPVDPELAALASHGVAYLAFLFAGYSDKARYAAEQERKKRDREECRRCYVYNRPCRDHPNPKKWQRADFELCPHIAMQLHWRTDDPTNAKGRWELELSKVNPRCEFEHESCKGNIKGVQLNVEKLGERVLKQMDRFRLKGPGSASAVARIIRDMPTFHQLREVESLHDDGKSVRDEAAAKMVAKQEARGLTVDLLENDPTEEVTKTAKKDLSTEDIARLQSALEVLSKVDSTTSKPVTATEAARVKLTKTDPKKKEPVATKETTAKKTTKKEPSKKEPVTKKKETTTKKAVAKPGSESKRYKLSEDTIYDSDEGLSDVELKEASKLEDQEQSFKKKKKVEPKKSKEQEPVNREKTKEKPEKKRKAPETSDVDSQQPMSKKRKESVEDVEAVEKPMLETYEEAQSSADAPNKRKREENPEQGHTSKKQKTEFEESIPVETPAERIPEMPEVSEAGEINEDVAEIHEVEMIPEVTESVHENVEQATPSTEDLSVEAVHEAGTIPHNWKRRLSAIPEEASEDIPETVTIEHEIVETMIEGEDSNTATDVAQQPTPPETTPASPDGVKEPLTFIIEDEWSMEDAGPSLTSLPGITVTEASETDAGSDNTGDSNDSEDVKEAEEVGVFSPDTSLSEQGPGKEEDEVDYGSDLE